MKLSLGESHRVRIPADERWVNTDIEFDASEMYVLKAEGHWRDLFTKCDAGGYTSRVPWMVLMEKKRRAPEARWFELIGAVDNNSTTYFRIGVGCEFSPDRKGRLFCFANDLGGMYWNNCGGVWLSVKRVI